MAWDQLSYGGCHSLEVVKSFSNFYQISLLILRRSLLERLSHKLRMKSLRVYEVSYMEMLGVFLSFIA